MLGLTKTKIVVNETENNVIKELKNNKIYNNKRKC